MIRVTEAEAATLFGNLKRTYPSRPRVRRPKEEMPENILESQLLGFLKVRGWVLIRQQPGLWIPYHVFQKKEAVARPIRMHEKGAADWLAIRISAVTGHCDLFFLEVKAPGRKPEPDQEKWLRDRRAVGFLADFFDSLETFTFWYRRHFE